MNTPTCMKCEQDPDAPCRGLEGCHGYMDGCQCQYCLVRWERRNVTTVWEGRIALFGCGCQRLGDQTHCPQHQLPVVSKERRCQECKRWHAGPCRSQEKGGEEK